MYHPGSRGWQTRDDTEQTQVPLLAVTGHIGAAADEADSRPTPF